MPLPVYESKARVRAAPSVRVFSGPKTDPSDVMRGLSGLAAGGDALRQVDEQAKDIEVQKLSLRKQVADFEDRRNRADAEIEALRIESEVEVEAAKTLRDMQRDMKPGGVGFADLVADRLEALFEDRDGGNEYTADAIRPRFDRLRSTVLQKAVGMEEDARRTKVGDDVDKTIENAETLFSEVLQEYGAESAASWLYGKREGLRAAVDGMLETAETRTALKDHIDKRLGGVSVRGLAAADPEWFLNAKPGELHDVLPFASEDQLEQARDEASRAISARSVRDRQREADVKTALAEEAERQMVDLWSQKLVTRPEVEARRNQLTPERYRYWAEKAASGDAEYDDDDAVRAIYEALANGFAVVPDAEGFTVKQFSDDVEMLEASRRITPATKDKVLGFVKKFPEWHGQMSRYLDMRAGKIDSENVSFSFGGGKPLENPRLLDAKVVFTNWAVGHPTASEQDAWIKVQEIADTYDLDGKETRVGPLYEDGTEITADKLTQANMALAAKRIPLLPPEERAKAIDRFMDFLKRRPDLMPPDRGLQLQQLGTERADSSLLLDIP